MAAMGAPRSKEFLLARHEGRVLEWIARRVPAWVMPDHMTALGVLAAFGIAGAYLLSNGDTTWLWGGVGAADRALAGRLARRDARPRAAHRAAEVRLLPRPPRGRARHRRDRARPRAVAVDAAGRGAGDRGRISGAVDQHLPRDLRVWRVHARLRPARPHRGAARADP